MKRMPQILTAVLIANLWLVAASFADESNSVRVFILAGQSNMEGKAPNACSSTRQPTPRPRTSSLICGRTTNGSSATMCSSSFSSERAADDWLWFSRSHRR